VFQPAGEAFTPAGFVFQPTGKERLPAGCGAAMAGGIPPEPGRAPGLVGSGTAAGGKGRRELSGAPRLH